MRAIKEGGMIFIYFNTEDNYNHEAGFSLRSGNDGNLPCIHSLEIQHDRVPSDTLPTYAVVRDRVRICIHVLLL